MSGTWKDGAQKGVYGVQDDLRHTYEQVFWGRQMTGNNAADLPEETKQTAADPAKEKSPAEELYGPDAELTGEEREAAAFAYQHAANAPGIRAEIEAGMGQPYRYGDAPAIPNNSETNAHAAIDFYGRGGVHGAGEVRASDVDAEELYGPANTPSPGDGGGVHGPNVSAPTTDAEELYGPATTTEPGDGGGVHGPSPDAPTTDAEDLYGPAVTPGTQTPDQGNDLTPEY